MNKELKSILISNTLRKMTKSTMPKIVSIETKPILNNSTMLSKISSAIQTTSIKYALSTTTNSVKASSDNNWFFKKLEPISDINIFYWFFVAFMFILLFKIIGDCGKQCYRFLR